MGSSVIWFATPRQVHQYLTCPLGESFVCGDGAAIKDKGAVYKVSEKTVYNHCNDSAGPSKLRQRRGGGYALRTVESYARAHLPKVIDASPEMDADVQDVEHVPGAAERRTTADAQLKEVEAKRKQLLLGKELGLYTLTSSIERELGERAQAFRLFLTSFARDNKSEIISLFGGDIDVSREIIELVAGNPDQAEALSGWAFSRSAMLLELYKRRIREALNTFAAGEWFTDEMREAWDSYEKGRLAEREAVLSALVTEAGGDVSCLDKLLERYDVRMLEEE
ncbi:MAG: hypothetical protein V3573_06805 [Desulfovibrionaceae bacterium]